MTIRERTSKMRGFISTMAGFFAGAVSATWPTLPKAVLGMAVTSFVTVFCGHCCPNQCTNLKTLHGLLGSPSVRFAERAQLTARATASAGARDMNPYFVGPPVS